MHLLIYHPNKLSVYNMSMQLLSMQSERKTLIAVANPNHHYQVFSIKNRLLRLKVERSKLRQSKLRKLQTRYLMRNSQLMLPTARITYPMNRTSLLEYSSAGLPSRKLIKLHQCKVVQPDSFRVNGRYIFSGLLMKGTQKNR